MNKRSILSLFLAGVLLGGLSVTFTGCIDNDEPEGIKVLREAKAGLLNAKTALAAAEAQKALAEAAKLEAEAEIAKAQAQVELLKGQAEAAKTQAEADLIQAEIEKVTAEAQKALYEAEKARADMELAVTQAEIAIKEALLSFESGPKQQYLQAFYSRYLTAQSQYSEAYEAYVKAQADYLTALADTKLEKYTVEKDLTNAVAEAQANLDSKNADIADLKAEIENAATMEPDDLYTRRDELETQLNGIEESLAQLELNRADVRYNNHETYEKVAQLEQDLAAAEATPVAIPSFTYTFPEAGVITGFSGETELVGEDYVLYVNRDGDVSGNYDNVKNTLTNNKYLIQRALLDDNDLAWNDALINEANASLKSNEEAYEASKGLWQEAVDFYNNGLDADLSKLTLSGYTELVEALDNYNTLIETANTALDNIGALYDAYEEAAQKVNDADPYSKKAWNVRYEAVKAADEAYKEAKAAAEQVRQDAEDQASAAYVNAVNDSRVKYNLAQAEIVKNQLEGTEVDTAQKAYEAAKEAEEKALEAKNNAYSEATPAYEKAEKEALYQKYLAIAAAEEAYAKAIEENADDKVNEEYEALKEAKDAAYSAYFTAQYEFYPFVYDESEEIWYWNSEGNSTYQQLLNASDALSAAWSNLHNNTCGYYMDYGWKYYFETDDEGNEIGGSWYPTWSTSNWYKATKTFDVSLLVKDEDGRYKALEVADLIVPSSNSNDLKGLVKHRSQITYGWASSYDFQQGDYYSDANYSIPYEQLIELTQEDIDKIIQTHSQRTVLYYYYYDFGYFGRVLYQKARIEIMEARKANPDLVAEAVASIDEALAALDKLVEDQTAVVAAVKENLDAQNELVAALEKEIDDQEAELNREQRGLSAIQTALLNVIETNGLDENADHLSAAAIEGYQAALADLLEDAEEEVPGLEDRLETAQKTLEGWQQGLIIAADAYKALMENQAADLAVKKETADLAKQALDDAIAYLESLD